MYRATPITRLFAALVLLFVVVVPPGAAQAINGSSDPALPPSSHEFADEATSLVFAPAAPSAIEPFDLPASPFLVEDLGLDQGVSPESEATIFGVVLLAVLAGAFYVMRTTGPDFDDDDNLNAGTSLSVQL